MNEFEDPAEFLQKLPESVKRNLDDGLSRQDIWKKMSANIDSQFHQLLKREVVYGLSEEQMTSINILNSVLQFLFTVIVLFTVFTTFLYYNEHRFTFLSAVSSIIFLGISYFISKGILLKRGHIYRLLFQIGILLTILKIVDVVQGKTILLSSALSGVGIVFSIIALLTYKKLFPNYKLFGDNSVKANVDL